MNYRHYKTINFESTETEIRSNMSALVYNFKSGKLFLANDPVVTHCGILEALPLWREVILDPVQGAVQHGGPYQQDGQQDVWEDGREIHNLGSGSSASGWMVILLIA